MDFGCLARQQGELRRTATDSLITKATTSTPTPPHSSTGASFSREDSFSSAHSLSSSGGGGGGGVKRLSPQSTSVHMGISSVQRKLQEQERTKLEVHTFVFYSLFLCFLIMFYIL
jgi:hypothetical protein